MYVGVARVVLQIPGARSLKDRRSVVKSYKDRLKARLTVSVAEVGDVEAWQVATIGIAVTSKDRSRCEEAISQAASMARSLSDAWLADLRTEVLSFGTGGERLARGIETELAPPRKSS